MRFGYARISKDEQDRALQLDALLRAHCDQIFEETGSRKNFADRPVIQDLLRQLRTGDELVVWKLDRFSGSLREILEMAEVLHQKGTNFISLTERIDTTTPIGELFFHLTGAFAQYERSLLIERTKAGLEAARARGRKGGRLPLPTAVAEAIHKHYGDRDLQVGDFCRRHRISRTTFYKYSALYREQDQRKSAPKPAPKGKRHDTQAASRPPGQKNRPATGARSRRPALAPA